MKVKEIFMRSDCPNNRELQAFGDNELDSTQHDQLMYHFEGCLKCRGRLGQLISMKRIMSRKIKFQTAPIRLKFSVVSKASSAGYEAPAGEESSSLHSLGFFDAAVPAGTHICFFYESEQERDRVISEYLEAGIQGGERCVGAVYGQKPLSLLKRLGEVDYKVNSALEREQLTIYASSRLFYPEGEFVPNEMINRLIQISKLTAKRGYPILRAFGDLGWIEEHPTECTKVMECEHRLNEEYFTLYPAVAICMYDMRSFNDAFLNQIFERHPYFIYEGEFKRNPSFVCA